METNGQRGYLIVCHEQKGLPDRILWVEGLSDTISRVEYNLYNPKVTPFGIALIKKANKVRRCW